MTGTCSTTFIVIREGGKVCAFLLHIERNYDLLLRDMSPVHSDELSNFPRLAHSALCMSVLISIEIVADPRMEIDVYVLEDGALNVIKKKKTSETSNLVLPAATACTEISR